jgi:hypothetical protein
MSLGRLKSSLGVVAAAAVFAATVTSTKDARAQGGPVQTWGKGTAGGALLGAEIIVIPLGAAGVNRGWPYFVFGGLGMVGGAIGGYFVDQKFHTSVDAMGNTVGGPAEPSVFMLAGGLALIIPAIILPLNANVYRPPDTDRYEPANNEPSKDAPRPSAPPPPAGAPPSAPPAGGDITAPPGPTSFYRYRSTYRAHLASVPHLPTSLLDVYTGKVGFGLPAAQVKPLYTQAEIYRYGVTQGTEVQIPVLKGTF